MRTWVSDVQFGADQIDQLDLALDQLALKDRNFDRFAFLLVDNVVELTLHRYAQVPEHALHDAIDKKAVAAARGQHFEPKVKFAKSTKMISAELAESIKYLHGFRNTAHHAGQRHEGILHALALFYFRNACAVLSSYEWRGAVPTEEVISYRAAKYLGCGEAARDFRTALPAAWRRLDEVAMSMGDTLSADLHDDMRKTVDEIDEAIQFLSTDGAQPRTRIEVVIHMQVGGVAWTDEVRSYVSANAPPSQVETVGGYLDWLANNYAWPIKTDPIPSWRKRLVSISKETNRHAALKRYCDFLNQTESLRDEILNNAAGLDALIDRQVDEARGID